MTKDEYKIALREYVISEMIKLPQADRPTGLRESVQFNIDKAQEFAEMQELSE